MYVVLQNVRRTFEHEDTADEKPLWKLTTDVKRLLWGSICEIYCILQRYKND